MSFSPTADISTDSSNFHLSSDFLFLGSLKRLQSIESAFVSDEITLKEGWVEDPAAW